MKKYKFQFLTGKLIQMSDFPIHEAIQKGDFEKVKFEFESFINCRDSEGRTPLHVAIESKCSKEQVELLLKYGADVNAQIESKSKIESEDHLITLLMINMPQLAEIHLFTWPLRTTMQKLSSFCCNMVLI